MLHVLVFICAFYFQDYLNLNSLNDKSGDRSAAKSKCKSSSWHFWSNNSIIIAAVIDSWDQMITWKNVTVSFSSLFSSTVKTLFFRFTPGALVVRQLFFTLWKATIIAGLRKNITCIFRAKWEHWDGSNVCSELGGRGSCRLAGCAGASLQTFQPQEFNTGIMLSYRKQNITGNHLKSSFFLR